MLHGPHADPSLCRLFLSSGTRDFLRLLVYTGVIQNRFDAGGKRLPLDWFLQSHGEPAGGISTTCLWILGRHYW